MSDDEDYYEWEEEYLFEDPVPDLVVRTYYLQTLGCWLKRQR